jgi:hypothetical protein
LEVTRQAVGLETVGGSTAVAGGLGTAATWVASTGSRAAGREAQTSRLAGACERKARVFLGGRASCAAWLVVTAPPKKRKAGFGVPRCVLLRAKRGRPALLVLPGFSFPDGPS